MVEYREIPQYNAHALSRDHRRPAVIGSGPRFSRSPGHRIPISQGDADASQSRLETCYGHTERNKGPQRILLSTLPGRQSPYLLEERIDRLVNLTANRRPDTRCRDITLIYGEPVRRADRAAAVLATTAVSSGDTAVVRGEWTPNTLVELLAPMKAGAVALEGLSSSDAHGERRSQSGPGP